MGLISWLAAPQVLYLAESACQPLIGACLLVYCDRRQSSYMFFVITLNIHLELMCDFYVLFVKNGKTNEETSCSSHVGHCFHDWVC